MRPPFLPTFDKPADDGQRVRRARVPKTLRGPVARASDQRKLSLADTRAHESIRTPEDVLNFLKQTQFSWRTDRPEYRDLNLEQLFLNPFSPDLWQIENILQYQLERAKRDRDHLPSAMINHIRELIRTISVRSYKTVKDYDVRMRAEELIGKDHPLHIRTEDAQAVIEGLQAGQRGAALEPAALAIEKILADAWRDLKSWMDRGRGEKKPDALTWTDLKKILFSRVDLAREELPDALRLPNAAFALKAIEEIEHLRPIRDAIYARRLTGS